MVQAARRVRRVVSSRLTRAATPAAGDASAPPAGIGYRDWVAGGCLVPVHMHFSAALAAPPCPDAAHDHGCPAPDAGAGKVQTWPVAPPTSLGPAQFWPTTHSCGLPPAERTREGATIQLHRRGHFATFMNPYAVAVGHIRVLELSSLEGDESVRGQACPMTHHPRRWEDRAREQQWTAQRARRVPQGATYGAPARAGRATRTG